VAKDTQIYCKLNLKEDYQDQVQSGQRLSGKTTLRQPRDLVKKKPKTESTYSFLGILKKGDGHDDKVDDEVRTTVASQNHVTETLRTEEFFLRAQYL
jgi:hypothetical protein